MSGSTLDDILTTSDSMGGSRSSGRHFAQLSLRSRVFLSQLPLALSVLAVLVVCLLVTQSEDHGDVTTPSFFAGVAGVGILTALAAAIPWDRLPTVAYWSIPLLDFVAIAPIWEAARFTLDGMSLLAAFPVFWLAWSGLYPALGITFGMVGSAAVTWWPYVTQLGQMQPEEFVRPTVVPLFMLALAVAASVLTRSLDRQRDDLTHVLSIARQQNRMLQTVLDTTDVGIVVTDRDGHDVIMNSAQRRLHLVGLPEGVDDGPEQILLAYESDGKTPIPVEDRPVSRAVRGESFTGRLIALGADSSQQFLSVSAQAMLDEEGTFDGTVVVFQNVTDLIDAIQAGEKILADVSHEFRTPLTSIIGFLDLAIEEEQDPAIVRYLMTSQRNAERLLTLVNALLDAAASAPAVSPEPVDLARLVRHSVESATVRAKHAAVALDAELPTNFPVMADPVKLSQVADNLISNAIKYTSEGGTVNVTVRQRGRNAELRVTDTGIGMSPEELDRLFTNFYRTEHVRRAAIPGTGLGLAISQGFIRAHGGEIAVESESGIGSVFTACIPIDGPPGPPAPSSDAPDAPDAL